jgi:hypothetical protein
MERRGLPASYNGTLYRSHLEARWAIFFDKLDIKARYEPQGFDLGDGTLYLPDFVIFGALGTLWAEVKPEWDADPAGVEKWRKFATVRPQPSRALLLIGPPRVEPNMEPAGGWGGHVVIGGLDPADTDDPLKGPWEDDQRIWKPCWGGYHFDLDYVGRGRPVDDGCPGPYGADGWDRIEAAVSAAMSHRFGKFQPQPAGRA